MIMGTNDAVRSVLVVEDEMTVGMDIAMTLEETGFVVHGPFKSAENALTALNEARPDFAILDLNLGNGQTSRDVAAHLSELGCPFVFLTGYGASSHPVIEEFGHAECISKPVDMGALEALIRTSVA